MKKPTLKIVDYNANNPNVQVMTQKADNEWTGRFCVKAVIEDNGDFTPEKNVPFEWTVMLEDTTVATGNDVLIEGDWVGNFMVKDAEKYETGTEFSPKNTDGSAMKIGGRFRNLDDFELTIGVTKKFSDSGGNVYYGYWEITFGAIQFEGDWGRVVRSETVLVDDDFPDDNVDDDDIDDDDIDDEDGGDDVCEQCEAYKKIIAEQENQIYVLQKEVAKLKEEALVTLDAPGVWVAWWESTWMAIKGLKEDHGVVAILNLAGLALPALLLILGWIV